MELYRIWGKSLVLFSGNMPLKFNMEPENKPFGKGDSFWKACFCGFHVEFRGVTVCLIG